MTFKELLDQNIHVESSTEKKTGIKTVRASVVFQMEMRCGVGLEAGPDMDKHVATNLRESLLKAAYQHLKDLLFERYSASESAEEIETIRQTLNAI